MNTETRALALHNYNAFSSLVDRVNTNETTSLEKFLKFAYVITKGTSTCNIVNTLLNCLRFYGARFHCSDRQRWAIAYGTAEKGIRINVAKQMAKKSSPLNDSGNHKSTGRIQVPITRNHVRNFGFSSINLSSLGEYGYVSYESDPTGIDIYDTVEFRKVDPAGEIRSAMIVKSDGDMTQGRISVEAPVGKAFLGHHEKDTVKVGNNTFEILSVKKRGNAA